MAMTVWKRQPALAALQAGLDAWFDSELGRALQATELELLHPVLGNSFGYHLLQLSIDHRQCLYGDSRILLKHRAGRRPRTDSPVDIDCEFDALPFASGSIDVVILHHVLEFAANPHAVLREVERVVLDGGKVFVLGYNPWSLQGVRTVYGRLSGRGIWQNHPLTASRVSDWMHLLGFETEPVSYAFHRPPVSWPQSLLRTRPGLSPLLRRWPLGAVYLVSAVKQVAPLVPLKPRWQSANGLSPLPAIRPSIGRQAARRPGRWRPNRSPDYSYREKC